MKHTLMAACLLAGTGTASGETLTLQTVDFALPDGIASQIPAGVRKNDIFVSNEACYYVRSQLSFVFIGCVG